MTKKIGILGGTFNPIHDGHLHIANAALLELNLDEIWFMPTRVTYYKDKALNYNINQIIKDIENKIKDNDKFKICRYEIDNIKENEEFINKKGTNYILDKLKNEYKDYEFYFILGADSLYQIESWREYDKLLKNNKFIVADRKYNNKNYEDLINHINYLKNKYHADITLLKTKKIDISSSDIRNE